MADASPMLLNNLFTLRSGIGFFLIAATFAIIAALPFFATMKYRRLVVIAGGLLAFQGFHFLEHVIQLGYWFMHPGARPYMTPWAVEALEGLGLWANPLPGSGTMMLRGMELLHLIGNTLFLVGLIALAAAARRRQPQFEPRGLRVATRFQTVHVLEHVLLTLSVFVVGKPLGLSTLFGFSEGTAWGGTVRVWFHFLINLAATAPAVLAMISYRRQRAATEPGPDATEPLPVLATSNIA